MNSTFHVYRTNRFTVLTYLCTISEFKALFTAFLILSYASPLPSPPLRSRSCPSCSRSSQPVQSGKRKKKTSDFWSFSNKHPILHKKVQRRVLRHQSAHRHGCSNKNLRFHFPLHAYLKFALQRLVDLHNRRHVSAAITIVRRRPHRHQSLVKHVLVSLHHQLMRPADQIQSVGRIELV